MATKLTLPRTATYERPFTHEGNYLVKVLKNPHCLIVCIPAQRIFQRDRETLEQ